MSSKEVNPNILQPKLFYGEQNWWDLDQEMYATEESGCQQMISKDTGGRSPYCFRTRQEHGNSAVVSSNLVGEETINNPLEEHTQDRLVIRLEELYRELKQKEPPPKGKKGDRRITLVKTKEDTKTPSRKNLLAKAEKKNCAEQTKISKKRVGGDKGKHSSGNLVDSYGQKRVKLRHPSTAQLSSQDGPLAYSFISLKSLRVDSDSCSAAVRRGSDPSKVLGNTEREGSMLLEDMANLSLSRDKYKNSERENDATFAGPVICIEQAHIEAFPFHDQDLYRTCFDTSRKQSSTSDWKSFSDVVAPSTSSKNLPLVKCGCSSKYVRNLNHKILEKFGKYLALRRFQLNCVMQEALLHGSKAGSKKKTLPGSEAEGLKLSIKNKSKTYPHALIQCKETVEGADNQTIRNDNIACSVMKAIQDLTLEDIHSPIVVARNKEKEKGLAHSLYFKEFFDSIWSADGESSLGSLQHKSEARDMPDFSNAVKSGELHKLEGARAEYEPVQGGSRRDLSPLRVIFEDRNKELLHDLLVFLTEEEKLIKEAWACNLHNISNNPRDEMQHFDSNVESVKLGNSPLKLKHNDKIDFLDINDTQAQEAVDDSKTWLQKSPQGSSVNGCSSDVTHILDVLAVGKTNATMIESQPSSKGKSLFNKKFHRKMINGKKDITHKYPQNESKISVSFDNTSRKSASAQKEARQSNSVISPVKAFRKGQESSSSNNKPRQKIQPLVASSSGGKGEAYEPFSDSLKRIHCEDGSGAREEENERSLYPNAMQPLKGDVTLQSAGMKNCTVYNGDNSKLSQIEFSQVQAKSLNDSPSTLNIHPSFSLRQQADAMPRAEAQQELHTNAKLYISDCVMVAPECSSLEADLVSLRIVEAGGSKDQQSPEVAELISLNFQGNHRKHSPPPEPISRETKLSKEPNSLDLSKNMLENIDLPLNPGVSETHSHSLNLQSNNRKHSSKPNEELRSLDLSKKMLKNVDLLLDPGVPEKQAINHPSDDDIFLERYYSRDHFSQLTSNRTHTRRV